MYGMKRTTIYLPEEMKARLEAEAARRKITESELIRRAVDNELHRSSLRAGIVTGDGGGLNAADITRENRHIWLKGFGES
jgi:predicted transcriptional regulator